MVSPFLVISSVDVITEVRVHIKLYMSSPYLPSGVFEMPSYSIAEVFSRYHLLSLLREWYWMNPNLDRKYHAESAYIACGRPKARPFCWRTFGR